MSQENVEVVLEHFQAFNRQDVDAFVGTVSPDVEWEDSMFFTEVPRVYRGRDEVREWFPRVLEPWESIHGEAEEIREASDGRIFAGGVMTVRGKGSHAEVRQRGWFVFWVANGTITKRRAFLDRDEALEAAGLKESAMTQENVEVVRRIYEAFDHRDLARAFDLLDPDFEWIPPDRSFEAAVRGRDNVQRFLEDQIETLDLQVQPEEFFEKDDQVIAFVRVRAQGHASGAGVEILAANVWTFRDGRPVRGEVYAERDKALKAAGLSE